MHLSLEDSSKERRRRSFCRQNSWVARYLGGFPRICLWRQARWLQCRKVPSLPLPPQQGGYRKPRPPQLEREIPTPIHRCEPRLKIPLVSG